MSRPHDHTPGHAHGESCSCALQSSGVGQTLEELDFERGLWSAALNGDEERVRKLLAAGNDPNTPDTAGYVPLHYASRSGHTSVCRLLLLAGGSVNAQTHGGVTPLHRAAYCGHGDTVKLLLAHGARAGMQDNDGLTPLHKAAERNSYVVAKLLIASCPAAVQERDNKGRLARDLVKVLDEQWLVLLSLTAD